MAKETVWKVHVLYKEDGRVMKEELLTRADSFGAAIELMNYKEYDLNRNDPTEEFTYDNENGIETWTYKCEKFEREVKIYPIDVEKKDGNEVKTKKDKIRWIADHIDIKELIRTRATLYDQMGGDEYVDLFAYKKKGSFVIQLCINGHMEYEKSYSGDGTEKELRDAIFEVLTKDAEGRPECYIEDIYKFMKG